MNYSVLKVIENEVNTNISDFYIEHSMSDMKEDVIRTVNNICERLEFSNNPHFDRMKHLRSALFNELKK